MEKSQILGNDAFQNEASRELFDAVDELKSCGASRDIQSLPEIVIVGDQSVGKSSLLQSLTDIPFPVAGGLCTRFPTRIVSRRHATERTNVSIEPKLFPIGESAQEREKRLERQARYSEFEESFSTFTSENFVSVIAKASKFMQMNVTAAKVSDESDEDSNDAETTLNFCEDTLKIEVQGPTRSHFAILDIPGNFQNLTGNLTSRDLQIVTNMIKTYMGNPQSIIVCVASGQTDLANQGVFDMALAKDFHGDRTIGVITKCDVTQEPMQVVEIVKNKRKPLRHGWFVIRNRTPAELKAGTSIEELRTKELDFFSSDPWNTISSARRGTQALKQTLANLLCDRIQTVFPSILEDIQKRMQHTQKALQDLGSSRETLVKKRIHLVEVALAFHTLILQGLQGRYASMPHNQVKLRMQIREANESFADDMKEDGHTVEFVEATLKTPSKPITSSPWATPSPSTSKNLIPEIYRLIAREIEASKGTELQGTLNPAVLPMLFHKQAKNWRDLAISHFKHVVSIADNAVVEALDIVCKDKLTRRMITNAICTSSRRQEERLSKNLTEHIDALLTKHLQTNNEAFEQKVKAARMQRFHTALESYRQTHPTRPTTTAHQTPNGTDKLSPDNISKHQLVIDMRETASLFNKLHMSNEQNLQDEIHDILKAYYEIARESFVEYVNTHIVERYLDHPEGPVYFFSPKSVGCLTDDEVEYVAAEDQEIVRQRASLQATSQRLCEAEAIAERYRSKRTSV